MTSALYLCSGVISLSFLDLVEKLGMGLYSLRKTKRKTLMRTLSHVNFKVYLSRSIAHGEEQPYTPKRRRMTCLVRLIPNAAAGGGGTASLLVYGKPLIQLHPVNVSQVRHGDCVARFATTQDDEHHWQLRFRNVYRMLVFLFLLDVICYDAIISPHLDFDGGDTDGEMSDSDDSNDDDDSINEAGDSNSIRDDYST
mmetsp:Transcript_3581/g.6005  ORF Transcript_3581/g.6005 Transcript_3581/m.6005 type:complete len:197 (-) Transcript_3581:157-747(-)|eukprot:CAMPEP_0119016220 /NCGR_PEP_ID=MMETSP1176-20130426/11881_1 /TAXON_ID=265551 /ORGANISM="Synedropsis recta cf, Strain CCMP1620" /LENGTH=196 /DNA_ID=CAMNT_0006969561 /DNA_START=41 /DNA_END=631 /DNA_ORIENTATION=+